MNLVKLQDTELICRNLLLFYLLIMNYQKDKVRKKILYKIPKNKLNQGSKQYMTYTLKTIKH